MANQESNTVASRPLAHTVKGASSTSTVGRTLVYEAIRAGELKARKLGKRTIILDDDLRRWLASLPIRAA